MSGYVDWGTPTVTITPTSSAVYNDGTNNWWKDSVSVNVAADDPAPSSGLANDPTTGPLTFTSSGSIAAGTYTATDHVGHSGSNTEFDYKVDSLAPTFGACSGGPFIINSGMQSVSITAQDETGGSGLDAADSTLTGTVDTSTAGSKTVTFTAEDNVGHINTKVCPYGVNYNLGSGFLSPVNNSPTLNTGKAGRTYPVKWQFTDAQGNFIAFGPGPSGRTYRLRGRLKLVSGISAMTTTASCLERRGTQATDDAAGRVKPVPGIASASRAASYSRGVGGEARGKWWCWRCLR